MCCLKTKSFKCFIHRYLLGKFTSLAIYIGNINKNCPDEILVLKNFTGKATVSHSFFMLNLQNNIVNLPFIKIQKIVKACLCYQFHIHLFNQSYNVKCLRTVFHHLTTAFVHVGQYIANMNQSDLQQGGVFKSRYYQWILFTGHHLEATCISLA